MKRVKGVTVTPHYCPIQDKDNAWYKQFQVIVMGLDSIEARRWLNAMACSLVEYEDNDSGERKPDLGCARHTRACSASRQRCWRAGCWVLSVASACARASRTVIPLVDGGTEGFSGHVRVIYPCVSGCFECTLDLFPPQQAVPLCTIAETPRNAAHCILYAHLIEYPKLFPDDKPDKDDPVYQNWVYGKAAERADKFGINGVTLMHTQVRAQRMCTVCMMCAVCAACVMPMHAQGPSTITPCTRHAHTRNTNHAHTCTPRKPG